ncbi:HPr family phosphocarrier protein [Siculibacillus lacustris]|uniref:Phosphocarrier protein HPr n=1 Tax=Siculibacillus lacustris TaxID=1549641 RepID=A0A4Q9VMM7_9HYPH|nr:HPr family phosphocarrier protein [Siculibacillus lacustris]TBW36754.1 HPr family phosphocarrier protein [Siculibacillus lacustris]
MTTTASAVLKDPLGLHARPSVKLVKLAKTFDATVEIAADPEGPWTAAKSLIKVMKVKARHGTALHVRATGADEAAAVAALVELVEADFPEDGSDG